MEWLNYEEDEDFKCHGDPEPHARAHYLIHMCGGLRWHVKITFLGRLIQCDSSHEFITLQRSKSTRRREFRDFIQHFEFHRLSLIENTITEIKVQYFDGKPQVSTSPLPLDNKVAELAAHNGYQPFIHRLYYCVTEDSKKVIYPKLLGDMPSIPLSCVSELKQLAPTTQLVCTKSEKNYVFKTINRPLYQPRDSDMVEKEIQNLRTLSPCSAIVEFVSIVHSPCPYYTEWLEKPKLVVRGFLMKYHENGSIQDILDQHIQMPWQKWPRQIATGLCYLHDHNITHMDLKPSNVVVDDNYDAKIIDISGMATTTEWTAPELRKCLSPTLLPLGTRIKHDVWAFGMLLSTILLGYNESGESHLHTLVENTTKEDPEQRISLRKVLSELERD
jgi:tRNA A-37 threonylcarbamoyl transferase component Bud32